MNTKKIGILGGGQLGKMLALAAHNWQSPIYILDAAPDFPAGQVATRFFSGSFKDYDDVYRFGQEVDILTVEIEHVNTEALIQLQKEGKTVHPDPKQLQIIKDKGLQKQFYQRHELPTSPFEFYENAVAIHQAIKAKVLRLPFVQKTRKAGYDGQGVAVIRSQEDLGKMMDAPSIVEPLVDIHKEIAVVVAQNEAGQIEAFPPVEMEFHPTANLVEFLSCPADISNRQSEVAQTLAKSVIEAFGICGLLAVELFLTKEGQWLINEVAPRPHNSGHHTIDSCVTSQFQQHLRAILNLPLGSTQMNTPSVMINLLGAEGHTGPTIYEGIQACMSVEGAKFHLYGKTVTKPFRKMGHATILDTDLEAARKKAKFIQSTLNIKA
ncbi:MAG: 5-(carboxyamino)imidazole ribonucleotide synthase [Bacteroidota bacterium]